MFSIKELNQEIAALNIKEVEAVLNNMSNEQVSSINGWIQSFDPNYELMPYDVALESAMKQFLRDGDHSVVKTCVDILDLLKQKGWNGIIINGILGKISNQVLITLHPSVTFDFHDYAMFIKELTNEVGKRFAPLEVDSIKRNAEELEDFLRSSPDPLCWKKEELDRMSKHHIHLKAISAACEEDVGFRCNIL